MSKPLCNTSKLGRQSYMNLEDAVGGAFGTMAGASSTSLSSLCLIGCMMAALTMTATASEDKKLMVSVVTGLSTLIVLCTCLSNTYKTFYAEGEPTDYNCEYNPLLNKKA